MTTKKGASIITTFKITKCYSKCIKSPALDTTLVSLCSWIEGLASFWDSEVISHIRKKWQKKPKSTWTPSEKGRQITTSASPCCVQLDISRVISGICFVLKQILRDVQTSTCFRKNNIRSLSQDCLLITCTNNSFSGKEKNSLVLHNPKESELKTIG